jgi:hypothetical protein
MARAVIGGAMLLFEAGAEECLETHLSGWAQCGMSVNCGRSSGFTHGRRRLVNISTIGLIKSGLSKAPS